MSAPMVSQGADPLFRKVLGALPGVLLQGLKVAGLDDAGILEKYPRDSNEDLLAAGVTGASTAVNDILAAGIAGGMVTPADMDLDGGTTMVHFLVCLHHPRHYRISSRFFYCLFLPVFSPSLFFRPPSLLAPPSTVPLICLCHDALSARLRPSLYCLCWWGRTVSVPRISQSREGGCTHEPCQECSGR